MKRAGYSRFSGRPCFVHAVRRLMNGGEGDHEGEGRRARVARAALPAPRCRRCAERSSANHEIYARMAELLAGTLLALRVSQLTAGAAFDAPRDALASRAAGKGDFA